MAVVSAAFLLAVGRALARILVDHDGRGRVEVHADLTARDTVPAAKFPN